jgi:nucleotide-binding universal stress UspA family protein
MISQMASPHQAVLNRQGKSSAYSRVLVPLDGSTLAEAAIPAALAFVQRAGADGTVILGQVGPLEHLAYAHGSYFELSGTVQKEMEAYLERVAEVVRTEDVAVEVAYAQGDPARGIADMTHDHHADLIVMVTHAREGLSRLVHRSVANRVLRETSVPVLLLKQDEQTNTCFSLGAHPHLLVPLDGSTSAASAASQAITLAQHLGAAVTVMRSLDLPDLSLADKGRAGAGTDAIRATIPADRHKAAAYLSKMQALLQSHEIPTSIALTEGGAAQDIVAQARALEDRGKQVIIVMAPHGRTGGRRLLFGSVASTVLHLADVPLFVIRSH